MTEGARSGAERFGSRGLVETHATQFVIREACTILSSYEDTADITGKYPSTTSSCMVLHLNLWEFFHPRDTIG